jgi:hypothetical protein
MSAFWTLSLKRSSFGAFCTFHDGRSVNRANLTSRLDEVGQRHGARTLQELGPP